MFTRKISNRICCLFMIFTPGPAHGIARMFVIRWRANMPFADIGTFIAAVGDKLAQHGPVFVVFCTIGDGADFMRISSGQHTGATRQAKRLGYIGLAEQAKESPQ